MAIINRDYLVVVDVRQSTINFNKDKIIFYITDKNTSNIFVNLATNISDNEYVDNYVSIEDAQNYKVTMNIVKPDNTYKIIEGTLLDEEKALYEFNLEEECKDQIGTYTCDIQSIRVDDEVERIITSNRFLYKVKAGVLNDLNEVIQSAESYPIVVELFDKLSYIERYEDERQANEEARCEAEEQRQNRYDGLIDTILSRIQSMDDKLIEAEERLTSKEQEVDDCIEENTAKIDTKIQETDDKINELDAMFSENLDAINEKISETNAKLIEMDKSMTTNTSKINAKIDEADDVIGEMKTSISNNTAKVDAKLGDVEKRISTKEKEVNNYISSAKTTLNTYQNTTTNRIDNHLRDKSVALDKYQANKDILINNKLNDALTQIDEKLANIDMSDIDLTGYAKTEDIPTNLSQLTNDSDFVNSTFVTTKIAEAQLSGGEVDLSEYAKTSDIPHVISEEVVFTIPASDVQTLINDGVIDIPFGGTLDTTKVYYAEYCGKDYKTANVDSRGKGLYFTSNGFYLEFEIGYNKDWDNDATKTRCALYEPNIITNASDIVIKTKEIEYLHNRYIDPNVMNLESLSSLNSSGITGQYSIVMGKYSQATGTSSFAVGDSVKATGRSSHAEGGYTTASGDYSHAEGQWVRPSGRASHAEGYFANASGDYSHAEGGYTTAASMYQHVQGKYNITDDVGKYAHIVGNGTSSRAKSNAHTLDWEGNAWYAGKLSQDGTPTEDKDLTTKKYVDNKVADLVDSSPETLDTLNELASALGNDPNFATTVATQIGNKVDKVDGKGLSTNDLTDTLKANYDIAYTHSQSSHFDGNYNDLTNKPVIPSKTSQLTNDSDFATNASVSEKIANIDIPDVDLTGYATEDYVNDAIANSDIVAGGLTSTAQTLLISILRNAVFTSDQSANITLLQSELAKGNSSGGSETTQYTISNSLSNATTSNSTVLVNANDSYSATITVNDGYELSAITVTMGGTDITSTAVSGSTITISAVTGNVVITVTTATSSSGGGSTGGGMVTDGLENYFDFRTATYNNDGSGGSTIISATQGNGSLFTWATNMVAEQGDYGVAIRRNMLYDGTSVGTTETSLGTSFTIIFKCYLTTLSSPFFDAGYGAVSNTFKLTYKPKYKTSSGTSNVTSVGLGTRLNSGYDTVTLLVDGNTCKLYFGTTLMQTNDGSTIDDFQGWYDKISGANILSGTGVGYLTQLAIYNKALSEVELVDMIDYLSTLEVK